MTVSTSTTQTDGPGGEGDGSGDDEPGESDDAPAAELPPEPTPPLPPTDQTWQQPGSAARRPAGEPGPSLPVPGRVPAGGHLAPADDIEAILASLREIESNGRYGIGPNASSASGAYQFVTATWDGHGGYDAAHLAPPEVQDAKARFDVARFLHHHDGDVSMIPVMWYFPLAASDPSWMDRVPNPDHNVLTVREYQARWLETFDRVRADMAPEPDDTEPAAVTVLSELPAAPAPPGGGEATDEADPAVEASEVAGPEASTTLAARSVPPLELPAHGEGSQRSIAFPVLGPVSYHDGWGDCRDGCSRRHQGTDIVGVPMQPLLAAVDGTIERLRHESSGKAGVILTIRDDDGWRYSYFHNNNDTPGTDDGQAAVEWRNVLGLAVGDPVTAGQIVGYMGDSGNAEGTVPHLHFEIRDPSGRARPSYWSLKAAEARQACTIGLGPWSFPHPAAETGGPADTAAEAAATQQAALERGVQRTEVTPVFGDGRWLIDTEGRVTATGDAALIVPDRSLDCERGPSAPFGTDAAGWELDTDPATLDAVLDDALLDDATLDAVLDDAVLDDAVLDTDPATLDDAVLEVADVADVADAPAVRLDVFRDPSTGEMIVVQDL